MATYRYSEALTRSGVGPTQWSENRRFFVAPGGAQRFPRLKPPFGSNNGAYINFGTDGDEARVARRGVPRGSQRKPSRG